MRAEEQHDWLIKNGYDEKTLKDNNWCARTWSAVDDEIHRRLMEPQLVWLQRCPNKDCTSVGTYKARYNPDYKEFARYYCCKWCGYGRTKAGEWQWYPDPVSGWGYKNERSRPTPKQLCEPMDPWCG